MAWSRPMITQYIDLIVHRGINIDENSGETVMEPLPKCYLVSTIYPYHPFQNWRVATPLHPNHPKWTWKTTPLRTRRVTLKPGCWTAWIAHPDTETLHSEIPECLCRHLLQDEGNRTSVVEWATMDHPVQAVMQMTINHKNGQAVNWTLNQNRTVREANCTRIRSHRIGATAHILACPGMVSVKPWAPSCELWKTIKKSGI